MAERDDSRVRLDKWLWAARFYKTRNLAAQAIDAGQARVRDECDEYLGAEFRPLGDSAAAESATAAASAVGSYKRVKPSHAVKVGESLTVRKSALVWEVEVLALSDRRGDATAAVQLYRETAQSAALRNEEIARRKAAALSAPQWTGRPSKRQRRKLQDFLDEA